MGDSKTSQDPPNYSLPRDTAESIRLTAQHYVVVERQGWLFHPQVQSALKGISKPQIADVAAGTGVWTIAAARELPNAEVTALDISTAQYPPDWTTSSNTNFERFDLVQPVPDKYKHHFDVVHVRLILPAGPPIDKEAFLSCFKTLLKPGGWLQWDELVYPCLLRNEPSPAGSDLDADIRIPDEAEDPLAKTLCDFASLETRTSWFNDFESVTAQHGFVDAVRSVIQPKRHLLKSETDQILMVVTEIIGTLNALRREKGVQTDASQANDMLTKMRDDVGKGIMYCYKWVVGVARVGD